jgi:peroxiredoxin Q/BCP
VNSLEQIGISMVNVGEAAPDFELKTFNGKSVKLSSFKGKKSVVVFFYPADSVSRLRAYP